MNRHSIGLSIHVALVVAFSAILYSCLQPAMYATSDELIIESRIKDKVEENISPSEFKGVQKMILVYNNKMILELFENDKLKISIDEKGNKSNVFRSFYYWKGDTLDIDGAFGLFGGTGFSLKIINGKAELFHMAASDEWPTYSYKENDSLIYRVVVPCTKTKIVLSEIPDSTAKPTIYGYVEFNSGDYFVCSGSADGQEILPRKKHRVNMKIYFKSACLNMK